MSVAFRFEKVALIRGAKGDYGTVVHHTPHKFPLLILKSIISSQK